MYNFKFADIGEGIHQGKVIDCFFKVGDRVENGESLFLVETDKVNAEIPSPTDGIITAINFEINDTIHVGDVVVIIDDNKGSQEKVEVKTGNKEETKVENNSNTEEPQEEEEKGASVVGEVTVSNDLIPSFHNEIKKEKVINKKSLATPVARRMAKDLGIDINIVEGTGLNGRVMKEDIQKLSEKLDAKDKTTEVIEGKKSETPNHTNNIVNMESKGEVKLEKDDRREEMSEIRKSIFKAMTISKREIPHTTLFDEIDLEKLVKLKKELSKETGVKLSYMPFIMKAVNLAIKKYPVFNSMIDGSDIIYKKAVNLGVAVDTEYGLVVPVIHDIERLSLIEVSEKIKELVSKSGDKKLSMKDITGGTFTISNFGKFAMGGTPVIKYPEVAILGVGKIKKQAVVVGSDIEIKSILPVSMSLDHRIIDGADGGRFIEEMRYYLENPKLLLLS